MTTVTQAAPHKGDTSSNGEPVPPLRNGDHLDRAEFERRYHTMPEVKKAELIEGVVYMPSPVSFDSHGGQHFNLITWLGTYRALTPGVWGADNTTVRLDKDNEPQPDGVLLIDPARGGRTQLSDGYITGGPELAAEVAASTVSMDANSKKTAYRRNGVREYILWRVEQDAIDWFVLRGGKYRQLVPGSDGVLRSEVFPGLWLDVNAMLTGDLARVLAVLQQGVASAEHAAFVAELSEQAQPKK